MYHQQRHDPGRKVNQLSGKHSKHEHFVERFKRCFDKSIKDAV